MLQLFTSIRPPADAEAALYLRDCVDSWRAAGFLPVAVNGPAEMTALRKLDLPVQFSVMDKDGKPRIGDLLAAIRQRSCQFAGIINSDCRIAGYPGLAANLLRQMEGRTVLAWRMDIGKVKPSAERYGFDAYFFDTKIMPADDEGFSIGDPWWDYWFPLACEMRGGRLETLKAPLLTHKVHPVNWTRRKSDEGARRLWTALRSWHPATPALNSIFMEIPESWWKARQLNPYQVFALSLAVPLWLHRERPQTIAIMPADMAELETMFCLGGQALLDNAELAILKNMLGRSVKPLRLAVATLRRARQAVFTPLHSLRASGARGNSSISRDETPSRV